MTTLLTLTSEQRTTFNGYLRARPFTDRERAYWQLCWLEITQLQLDSLNALVPVNTVATAKAFDGKQYINSDIISDAIDAGRLAAIHDTVAGLTWRYIDPWQWEQSEVATWQPYDGTPATIYQTGNIISHSAKVWVSTTPNNVWEPGVFGWEEQSLGGMAPSWRQPLGAGDEWLLNDEVLHKGRQYRSNHVANVWEPGAVGSEALWIDITVTEPPATVLPWVQPTGSEDAYAIGNRVTHDNPNDASAIWVYESAINANTTEPGRDGTLDRWWTPIEAA